MIYKNAITNAILYLLNLIKRYVNVIETYQ